MQIERFWVVGYQASSPELITIRYNFATKS